MRRTSKLVSQGTVFNDLLNFITCDVAVIYFKSGVSLLALPSLPSPLGPTLQIQLEGLGSTVSSPAGLGRA